MLVKPLTSLERFVLSGLTPVRFPPSLLAAQPVISSHEF